MNEKDDDPVFNEPVATGQLRTLLAGDTALAKTYVREARRMVGQLRSNYGVNERIAAGEPGGFYKQNHTFDDGVRIEVHTNDGTDTIKIYTPPAFRSTSGGDSAEAGAERVEVSAPRHSYVATHQDSFATSEPSRKTEEEESSEEKKEEFSPYLWVGIRVNQPAARDMPREPSMPFFAINAMMVEPFVKDTAQGAVMNSNQHGWDFGVDCDLDAEQPVLSESIADALSNFADSTAFASAIGARLHNLRFHDTAPSAGGINFNFSANGLRCYAHDGHPNYNEDTTPPDNAGEFLPYDPDLAADKQDGKREFSPLYERYYDARIANDRTAWDVVYVLDPQEDEQVEPCDPRVRVDLARRALEDAGMASGQDVVLPGDYVLHIGAYGSNTYQSSRAGDRSRSWGGLDPGYFWPQDADDMMDYLYLPYDPLQLQVEVRLGKDPDSYSFSYDITIENYAQGGHMVLPGGIQAASSGCPYGGPNPRGPNWWTADLIIDVQGGACDIGFQDEAGVFGDGVVDEPDNRRYGADLYIYTGAGVSGDASSIGAVLYDFLLQQVCGYWGDLVEMHDTSAEALAGQLAGLGFATIGGPDIIRYQLDSGTMNAVPRLPDPVRPPGYVTPAPDTLPAPTPDGWVWFETLEWFYPYSYISKSLCRTPYWMVCVGPQVGSGAFIQWGDPDMGLACC